MTRYVVRIRGSRYDVANWDQDIGIVLILKVWLFSESYAQETAFGVKRTSEVSSPINGSCGHLARIHQQHSPWMEVKPPASAGPLVVGAASSQVQGAVVGRPSPSPRGRSSTRLQRKVWYLTGAD